jgi:hypothetical protein
MVLWTVSTEHQRRISNRPIFASFIIQTKIFLQIGINSNETGILLVRRVFQFQSDLPGIKRTVAFVLVKLTHCIRNFRDGFMIILDRKEEAMFKALLFMMIRFQRRQVIVVDESL